MPGNMEAKPAATVKRLRRIYFTAAARHRQEKSLSGDMRLDFLRRLRYFVW